MNNLTQQEFAQKIGVHRNTVSKWLKNDDLPEKNIHQILGFFKLTKQQYDGLLNDRVDVITEYTNGEDTIIIKKPFKVVSDTMEDVIALGRESFSGIPMFSKGEYAIQVTGNSMKGYINAGDWVIIRRIHNIDLLIYGECYLVVTVGDNQKTIKFIKECPDDGDCLYLVPYNVQQFEPQRIQRKDIQEIYQVIGMLRRVSS